eukprot:1824700-Amphidinium_carterae.2
MREACLCPLEQLRKSPVDTASWCQSWLQHPPMTPAATAHVRVVTHVQGALVSQAAPVGLGPSSDPPWWLGQGLTVLTTL